MNIIKISFISTGKELSKYDRGFDNILASVFPNTPESFSCHYSMNKFLKE